MFTLVLLFGALLTAKASPFYYEELRDITISETSWFTIYNIQLDSLRYDYESINVTIQCLKNDISKINESQVNNHLLLKLKQELELLEDDAKSYHSHLDNLLSLMLNPTQKSKRGLFNVVGTIHKYLFGTADDDDRQTIFGKLDFLERQSNSMLNNNEAQVQIMTHLDHRISNNTLVFNELIDKAKFLNHLLVSANRTEENRKIDQLFSPQEIESTFRELLLLLGEAKFSLLEFTQALQESYSNHLSYNLVRPQALMKALHNIELKASAHLNLPFIVNIDNLPSFYQLIKVHTVTNKYTLKIILQIPLVHKGDYTFLLLKMHPLPIYHSNIKKWIIYGLKKNLIAINNNTGLYFLTSSEEINDNCGDLPICSQDVNS